MTEDFYEKYGASVKITIDENAGHDPMPEGEPKMPEDMFQYIYENLGVVTAENKLKERATNEEYKA